MPGQSVNIQDKPRNVHALASRGEHGFLCHFLFLFFYLFFFFFFFFGGVWPGFPYCWVVIIFHFSFFIFYFLVTFTLSAPVGVQVNDRQGLARLSTGTSTVKFPPHPHHFPLTLFLDHTISLGFVCL